MQLDAMRAANGGALPAYAWPGGYPMEYVTRCGAILCAACADADDAPEDPVTAGDVLWEGPEDYCESCGVAIPSAYGDPDVLESEA
jgi:hypothetical protein